MSADDLLPVLAQYTAPVTADHLRLRLGLAPSNATAVSEVTRALQRLKARGLAKFIRRQWRHDAWMVTENGRKALPPAATRANG